MAEGSFLRFSDVEGTKRRLVTQPELAIPAVVFTSSSNPQDRQYSIDLGAKDYVQKPTDLRKFVQQVSQIVRTWGRPEPTDGVTQRSLC